MVTISANTQPQEQRRHQVPHQGSGRPPILDGKGYRGRQEILTEAAGRAGDLQVSHGLLCKGVPFRKLGSQFFFFFCVAIC